MPPLEVLKKRLGFDPLNAGALRTGVDPASINLATDVADALERINSSLHVKKPLTAADVHLHTIEAASDRYIPDRRAFLRPSTLKNIAEDAVRGFAFLTRHETGGFFGGGENPYGRTFAAKLEERNGVTRVLVQFYMLRDHAPNGHAAPGTDDIHRGMEGGTIFDASVGLKRGPSGRLACDVCDLDLFDCSHMPGTTEGMTGEQIAKQKERGVPGGHATFSFDNFHAKEVSVVFDGALEGAGTGVEPVAAFEENTEAQPKKPAAREREEAAMKYSKELKISLGLSESATDEQVEAKLAELKALAGRTETAEAEQKKLADAAFAEKYKGKLSDDVIAEIKGLANRDTLAEKLVAQAKAPGEQTPPVGDPLKGTSAAAASTQKPPVGSDPALATASEQWREGLGIHDDEEAVNKAALTPPMTAMAKVLGLKTLHPTQAHRDYDRMAVENRRQAYQIPTA